MIRIVRTRRGDIQNRFLIEKAGQGVNVAVSIIAL
jgi:hypothetical protein